MNIIRILIFTILVILTSCHISFRYGYQKMLDRDGVKLITVKINDRSAILIVDSGAKTTMLDKSFCDRINLNYIPSSETINGIGGVAKIYKSDKFNFKILNNQISFISNVGDLSAVVKAFRNSNLNISGVLGADFLNSKGCIINYKTNILECGNNEKN